MLLFDSLTRYVRALCELGLAVGELPTRRGYPPRVFAELPRLIEMSGPTREGSVTAFFTVLAEDEDASDPVVEEARACCWTGISSFPRSSARAVFIRRSTFCAARAAS